MCFCRNILPFASLQFTVDSFCLHQAGGCLTSLCQTARKTQHIPAGTWLWVQYDGWGGSISFTPSQCSERWDWRHVQSCKCMSHASLARGCQGVPQWCWGLYPNSAASDDTRCKYRTQLSHPMSTGQLGTGQYRAFLLATAMAELLMPRKVRRICFAGAVATSNWPSMQEAGWQDDPLHWSKKVQQDLHESCQVLVSPSGAWILDNLTIYLFRCTKCCKRMRKKPRGLQHEIFGNVSLRVEVELL